MSKNTKSKHSQLPPTVHWHNQPLDTILKKLNVDIDSGLSAQEVTQRLQIYGHNLLPLPRKRSTLMRFLRQFHNVLIYVMLCAATITGILGDWVDTGVLLAAIFVNSIIGFVQEGKAEDSLDAIRNMLSLHTNVIRNGQRLEIEAEKLVPGDLVFLVSGDKIPADLRLLTEKGLRVNEAILTGESQAAEKKLTAVATNAPLGDRHCMLYSGTLVVSGQAKAVVVETGVHTELGRISAMLSQVENVSTPLIRQIAKFGHWLASVIVLMSVATYFIGVTYHQHNPKEMFMMVVALAASAIPEGLPAIVTITLAMGVRRMAKRNAIIRQLPAVETLGSVTVICSDKTGTLTRNEMTVQLVVTTDQVFSVTGGGYAPEGEIHVGGSRIEIDQHPELQGIARAVALCNDAQLRQLSDNSWQIEGDPTEGALLTLVAKIGLNASYECQTLPRLDSIPFESEHQFMATLHSSQDGKNIIYVKGAPERIYEMCDLAPQTNQSLHHPHEYWEIKAKEAASSGLRLLAVAMKVVDGTQKEVTFSDLKMGFTLLALVGIIDPPRDEAVIAVGTCDTAGISVKMITGDHVDTARAIGASLGIGLHKHALTGSEIEVMDDAYLQKMVLEVDVFARASPEHKLRLVGALQKAGHIVAMTGDGVNDAPALKRADVGIAMGMKGTEAAKEAADMVLADDNFATIGNAVREGRGIYDNIRKFILFMLPTNGGEALVIIAAILFELTLPMTPAQILWINMVTSSTLGLALAFEKPELDVMHRLPRNPSESLLSWFFAWRVLMVSVLMMAGSLGLFLWEMERGSSLETARTMAVSAVVGAEIFYLLNSRYIYKSVMSIEGVFGNRFVLIAIACCVALQLAYTHAPPLQALFNSTDLSYEEWLKVVLVGVTIFTIAEFEKLIVYLFRKIHLGMRRKLP